MENNGGMLTSLGKTNILLNGLIVSIAVKGDNSLYTV